MLETLFNIPHTERKIFKQHFLKGVVVAFIFNKNINQVFCVPEEQSSLCSLFNDFGYDNSQEIKNKSFKISLDNEITQAEQSTEVIGKTFINSSNNNQIQIINDRLIFIQNSYEDFGVLITHIEKIKDKLFQKLDASITQIGFRKINSIICGEITSHKEITELFNSSLFSLIKTDLFTFNDLENYRDNFTLSKNNIKCIINTACSKIINLDNSYEITIDTDIINKNIANNDLVLDVLNEINEMHFDLFCWMTSDKLKRIMNKEV